MSLKKFYDRYQKQMHCCLSSVQHYVLDNKDKLAEQNIVIINHGRQRNKYNVKQPHKLFLLLRREVGSQPEHLRKARQKLKEQKENSE